MFLCSRIISLIILANMPFPLGLGGGGAAPVAVVQFSPTGFTSPAHASQAITLTCATPGTQIRITTNGTDPTFTNGVLKPNPGTVTVTGNADTLVKAVAFIDASHVSAITEAEYDFSSG